MSLKVHIRNDTSPETYNDDYDETDVFHDENQPIIYSKQEEYGRKEEQRKLDSANDKNTKPNKTIVKRKDINGELDLDFLDIPAFFKKTSRLTENRR